MRLERETNKSFPAHQSLTRLGTVNERIELVRKYAKEHPEYSDVLEMLPKQGDDNEESSTGSAEATEEGYVYMGLLKIGREKR